MPITREDIVTDKAALRKQAIEVTPYNIGNFLPLILEARDWVANSDNNALGLAAVQVGSAFHWFVMRNPSRGKGGWLERSNNGGKIIIMANARIVGRGGQKIKKTESCFSIPGKAFRVSRWSEVVAAYDEVSDDGSLTPKRGKFTGRSAQILQHEELHCRGVTLADYGHEA